MDLRARLMADLKEAMRSSDTVRRDAIRMARAAVVNAEIELQRPATDEEVAKIIAREIRVREEAIELARKGAREDRVAAETAAIQVLQSYLPAQASRDEIDTVVHEIVAELGATGPAQMGPVMKQALARLKGRADGRVVNEVVREVLSHQE